MNSKYYGAKQVSIADRAIDGLFGGLAAGALMGVVMVLAGLLIGITPPEILQRFSSGQGDTPQAGALLHLSVSAVYGVIFSLLMSLLPPQAREIVPGWLAGLVYAGLLLALATGIILPGLRSPLGELPPWLLGLGHFVYGIVLGWRANPKSG
jgi:hypothetical protein